MRISIVIAARNEAAHVRNLLSSVLAQEPLDGASMEVLVADGMSDDGTRAILEEYAGRVRIIDNPGRIVSTGLNAAIAASTGDVILRMDAHTEYAPDYVRRCVEALMSTGADNAGGPARTRSTGWLPRAIAAAYHSRFACGGARFHDAGYEGYVDTVPYGCWRRSTFTRLGGFDETLVRNQDDEFNLRLTRSGGRIWQSPSIVSWYHPRDTLGGLFRQYFQYGYWKVAVIRKHRLPASVRHLVPALFVGANLAFPWACAAALLSGWPVAWPAALWTGMLLLYAAANCAASVAAAKRWGWSLAPVLPLVFAVFHVSYGLGFLLSSALWIIWPHRAARPARLATQITR
jgi:glycosyltransferase involved in cell wall biosynthesis